MLNVKVTAKRADPMGRWRVTIKTDDGRVRGFTVRNQKMGETLQAVLQGALEMDRQGRLASGDTVLGRLVRADNSMVKGHLLRKLFDDG